MEKNNWKKGIGLIFILFSQYTSWAQASLQYLPCQVCPATTPAQNFAINTYTDAIVSDFGRRNAPGATAWHRGTDLTVPGVNDYGYHLLSPVAGVVTQLVVTSQSYKYIVIDGPGNQDYGYGHIFNDNNLPIVVGDLVLKQCNYSGAYAVINLTTGKAIGPVNGSVVTFNGVNYTVSNQVQAGQVIAPLGTSGGVASHLHLYHPANPAADVQMVTNAKDPMELLNHYATTYQNAITSFSNIAQSTGSGNCAGGEYGSVVVQCMMKNPGLMGSPPDQFYHTAVMDVDRQELFIRRKNDPAEPFSAWGSATSNYQLIKGPHYYSYISNGSRLSTTGYPSTITGPDDGSTSLTGVCPYAYNQGPYDLYYFSDIVTRIHKNHNMGQNLLLARLSDEARYADGNYCLFERTTRVTGQQSANDASANNGIRIDNFRPYIKKVTQRTNSISNPFYIAEWNFNGNSLEFSNPVNNPIAQGLEVILWVTSSEPLADLKVATGIWSQVITTAVSQSGGLEWEAHIPASALHVGDNVLRISGHDLAGNNMEGFLNEQPKPASSFPVRISATQWAPAPFEYEDVVHHIKILDNTPLQANFFPEEIVINQGDYVSFFDLSTGGNIEHWQWVFEEGSPSVSDVQDPVVQFNTMGTHSVSLTINNSTQYSTFNGTVKVCGDLLPPQAGFSPVNVNVSRYADVHFFDLSEGNPIQWFWDFDGGAQPSADQNPVVAFDQLGTFYISLTVLNDAGIDVAMGTITVVEEQVLLDVMCSANPFMASTGTLINFQGSVFNGQPPYTYLFDFGDGTIIPVSSSSMIESVNHAYTVSGNFNLTVSVTDALNRMSSCTESVMIMGGNPCAGLTASFTTDQSGGMFAVPVNNPIVFSSNSSGGTPPYLYHWSFSPDPISGAQPSVSSFSGQGPVTVTFPQTGNYPVELYISDMNSCGNSMSRNITVFQPQHCLVARINKLINGKMNVPLGVYNFWDFTFVPWCGLCEDPPGSSIFPCETNNYWKLTTYPGNSLLAQDYGYPFLLQGCFLNSSMEQLFQYSFSQEGFYKLSLKAWDQDCNVVSGFDCQDETSLLIHAIDCDLQKQLCNSNFVVHPGHNEDVFTGTITAGGPNCPFVIPADAEIKFLAVSEIRLEDGFESRQNSEFRGAIQSCPTSEGLPLRQEQPQTAADTAQPLWEVYPNPVLDWLSVRFYADQPDGYDLRVYDLLGECVLSENNRSGKAGSLDFTAFPPGIYFLQYKGALGTLSKRIIRK